ncbi:hypothetical protein EEJ42_47075 [Streptomyces botrytidirepellens]|uniref:NIPSNAP domain-containing protein n=2 Tax=Streptomyces botrytidirepellens TaxID=2486417 RepID=A0A3M8SPN2_9ACTN|nr:hypothetical protein EEJ42_47075 [Streptomyces botrytidirepellens]
MLYLVYTFEATEYARRRLPEFWEWMRDRNEWFYAGLGMVQGTGWRIETSSSLLLIHHEVAFADDSGLAEYRAALAARGRDPAWEQRRLEQDRWYRIVRRGTHTSPPVPLDLPAAASRNGSRRDGRGRYLTGPRPRRALMNVDENPVDAARSQGEAAAG